MEYTLVFIPEDKLIILNNEALTSDEFYTISEDHKNIRAIHWTPSYKHVEFVDGSYQPISTEEDYTSFVFPYVLKANEYLNTRNSQVPDINDEEYCAKRIRAVRDKLLKDTDYLMLSDNTLSPEMSEKVKEYRQALRDITNKEGFPWPGTETKDIPWPLKPLTTGVSTDGN